MIEYTVFTYHDMNKTRDISIDILKCIAAIVITNSHMELLYGKYNVLATGGAIGDVLFFFCSGFTLFLGKMGRFDNWYKRRKRAFFSMILQNDRENVISLTF